MDLSQSPSSKTTHNKQSYSCIGRLEEKYKDISYDSLKEDIEKSIISIKKGEKNNGFTYDNYKNEFHTLQEYIDYDMIHSVYLGDDIEELCRYSDLKTYKHNKIEIDTKTKYINASPINIISPNYFIATQGPKSNTIEDFWTMVEQYNCNIIIMLCKLVVELGNQKCEEYWSTDNKMKKYTLEIVSEKDLFNDTVIIERKIKLINKKTKKEKIVTQLHYSGWPERGTPEGEKVFKDFIYMIKEIDKLKGEGPGIVHCKAGVGRTGTFISIYFLYKEIIEQINDKNLNNIEFSVFNLVRKLKEMRMYMVHIIGQYKFIYEFIEYLLKEYNKGEEQYQNNIDYK